MFDVMRLADTQMQAEEESRNRHYSRLLFRLHLVLHRMLLERQWVEETERRLDLQNRILWTRLQAEEEIS